MRTAKYKLPKDFGNQWVCALRTAKKLSYRPTPMQLTRQVYKHANELISLEMLWDLTYVYLNNGGYDTAAEWIENNVEFI